jgi:hypothetical protein
MSKSNRLKLFLSVVSAIWLVSIPLQSQAIQADKERLVLMPLRVSEADTKLLGAMNTALVQGLQERYNVYFGSQVEKTAHEIFLKETHAVGKTECDEVRCMQGIAQAFNSELIATANITKQEDGYFVALSIQNIVSNKVILSRSLPCQDCSAYKVVDKLKELVTNTLNVSPQSSVAANTSPVSNDLKSGIEAKERLVLMPLRLEEEDRQLQGAMETALVEGLQEKYEVFAGEVVSKKAREIFLRESRNMEHKECDETRCMQNIAGAFQTEFIATANVTKREDGYFLALSIQNIFDNLVVYSNSMPCEYCSAYKVVKKLKELSKIQARIAEPPKPQQEVVKPRRAATPNF